MTNQAQLTAERDVAVVRQRRRGLLASGIGNLLEWYDWNAYALFALFFAGQFFGEQRGVQGLLAALAVFAVGFAFRPIGGIVLASVADRYGRKVGLVLTVLLMAGGSLLIAVSPTYQQVGLLAPILLVVARAMQGLSTGGEFAASAVYVSELAATGRRGLYSSVQYLSTTVGTMIATLLSLGLNSTLSEEQMTAWGWRVPFLVGALIGVWGLVLRRTLEETEAFVEHQRAAADRAEARSRRPSLEVLRRHPVTALQVIGLTVGVTVWYYTFAVYLPQYVKGSGDADPAKVDLSALGAQAIFCVALPLFGLASDRFGRRLFLFGFAGVSALAAVPLFHSLQPTAGSLFVVQSIGLLIFALYGAIAPTAMAEMFPTRVRAVGIGMPYAVAVAAFGGTAPYVLTSLEKAGRVGVFPWYVALLCLITFVTVVSMRERRAVDLRDI